MRAARNLTLAFAAAAWLLAGGTAIAQAKRRIVVRPAAVAESALPFAVKAAPAGAPNVIFIIADDLNDWVGWLGGHPQARTPNMDRLAKMGMRFTNAHCSYALCNPSRTSLLTGMLPSTSGVFGNEQDWRRSKQIAGKLTLPEHFRANGFITAAGGKIFHANHGGPDGRLAGWHGGRRGFERDMAWQLRFPQPGVQIPDLPVRTGRNFNGLDIWHWDWGGIQVEDEQTDDGQVVAWAADMLAQRQAKPFFLAVGLYRPHSPWYVPQKYFDERPLDRVELPRVKADDLDDVPPFARSHVKGGNHHQQIVSRNLWKEAVRAYLANVDFCDAMLGRLLDALLAGPNAKNTVVVFTSDHGWYLGEKQMWHKGRLWEEATRVPLTILAPGITRPDAATGQPVSLIDVYPTICDLARLPQPGHLDGESLLPILRDPSLVRERPVITMMGGGRNASYAARSDRWRFIRYADGSEELYDHETDPEEWSNLAAKPEHEGLKKSLAQWFPKEWKSAARSPEEIAGGQLQIDTADYWLQPGDELPAAHSPQIAGKGVMLDFSFDFDPLVDQDSTLVSQGDRQAGYVLHLVDANPRLTIYTAGKTHSLSASALSKGRQTVRAMIGTDGTASIAVPGHSEMSIAVPFSPGFPRQPAAGLAAGQSFGILSAKEFPNSTPFDGRVHRARLTVFPPGRDSPATIPAAVPVDDMPPNPSVPSSR